MSMLGKLSDGLDKSRLHISQAYPRLTVREFRENLAEALRLASHNENKIIVKKNGEERVGIVSLDYIWLIDQLEKNFDLEEILYRSKKNGEINAKDFVSLLEGILEEGEEQENGNRVKKKGVGF